MAAGPKPGRSTSGVARQRAVWNIGTSVAIRSAVLASMKARSPLLNLNGYTDLPPGKIATIVTYLEMRTRPRLKARPWHRDWTIERIEADLPRYRALFRRVGEPWLWFSRAVMPDAILAGLLAHPDVEAYALRDATGDIGLLEIDFREARQCELQFFGVVPEVVGTGAGRILMDEAIRRAVRKRRSGTRIERFKLHTCSLDHPAALPFYLRAGFEAVGRAIEVADDPRLLGLLPPAAAPQVPLINARPRRTTGRVPRTRRKPS